MKGETKMSKKTIKKAIFFIIGALLIALIVTAAIFLANLKDNSPLEISEKPIAKTTYNQPFVNGETGDSDNFRIPALITLNNGRLVNAVDARYDQTQDGGGLDTVVAYSDDNGQTWNSYTANYLGDNGNKFDLESSAFIDPELLTDGENIWMMTTFYSGGRALSGYTGLKTAVKKSAFNDDGTLKLSKNHGLTYSYKVDINHFENGYSSIVDKKGNDTGYKIDEYFFLYNENNEQIGNIFYIKSKSVFSVVPTTFLYMTKSTDGGASFGAPKLINAKKEDESFYGAGPGKGIITSDGTLIMSAYYVNVKSGKQASSFIYSTDGGDTWFRSDDLPYNEKCEYSGESQIIELPNGNLRCFFRNNSNKISYADAVKENEKYTWSDVTITDIDATTGCMLSAIRVTNADKEYILISCPTGSETDEKGNNKHTRTDGKIFAFELDGNNDMSLINTTEVKKDTFMYSCMTVDNNGDIAIVYESENGEITFEIYGLNEILN